MDFESNKLTCRRFIQTIFNRGELDRIFEFVTPDAVNHELDALCAGSAPPGQSPEWMADLVDIYRRAFPDLRLEVQGQVAEDDRVVTWVRIRGTQTNALMGIGASGRTIDVSSIRVDRFTGGKIAESWFHLDSLTMLRQLSVLPEINRRPVNVLASPRAASMPSQPWVPAAADRQSVAVS